MEENGEHALLMMYKAMQYQYFSPDTNVINYMEFGSTYYIILKGEVNNRL
jgi:hypothetical protein